MDVIIEKRGYIERCWNTVSQGYWRHLVLLGLLGVLKLSLNSESQSHTQSPCKPDNCCVFIRNNDIMVIPLCTIPNTQCPSDCYNMCKFLHLRTKQKGR